MGRLRGTKYLQDRYLFSCFNTVSGTAHEVAGVMGIAKLAVFGSHYATQYEGYGKEGG